MYYVLTIHYDYHYLEKWPGIDSYYFFGKNMFYGPHITCGQGSWCFPPPHSLLLYVRIILFVSVNCVHSIYLNIYIYIHSKYKQAGAELCQAQDKLGCSRLDS